MKKTVSVLLMMSLLLGALVPTSAEGFREEYCGITYTVPGTWQISEDGGGSYYTEISCDGRTAPAWFWIEYFYISHIDPDDVDALREHFIEMLESELGSSYFGMVTDDIRFAGKQGFLHSYVFSYQGESILYAAHCIACGNVLICCCAAMDYEDGPLINHEFYEQVMSVLDSMDISGFDREAALGGTWVKEENEVKSV